jgi:flagellar basal-body rod protein FlgB
MVPSTTALFQLISARMSWLSQRQVVLSQNIANADTPDYQPKDLRVADFTRLVEGFADRPGKLTLAQTAPAHLEGAPAARVGLAGHAQRTVYEVAPDGGAKRQGRGDRARLPADQQSVPEVSGDGADCAGPPGLRSPRAWT